MLSRNTCFVDVKASRHQLLQSKILHLSKSPVIAFANKYPIFISDMALQEEGYDPFKSSMTDSQTSYFPFGKPGGGAPMKSDQGRIVPQRRGVDFNRELDTSADKNRRKEAADEYLHELRKHTELINFTLLYS